MGAVILKKSKSDYDLFQLLRTGLHKILSL